MTHAVVNKQETRKLREVVEIVNVTAEGVSSTNTPFMWDAAKDKFFFKADSKVFEKIGLRYGITKEELFKEFAIRTKLLYELFKKKVTGFEEVQHVINEYYKNPEAVLSEFGLK
jgi:hypothetical protein